MLDAAVTDLIFAPADVVPSTAVHDSKEGAEVSVTATASGSGTLSFNWTLTEGANTVAQSNNPTFQFTPLDNGNYTVTVQVTDSTDVDRDPVRSSWSFKTSGRCSSSPRIKRSTRARC